MRQGSACLRLCMCCIQGDHQNQRVTAIRPEPQTSSYPALSYPKPCCAQVTVADAAGNERTSLMTDAFNQKATGLALPVNGGYRLRSDMLIRNTTTVLQPGA